MQAITREQILNAMNQYHPIRRLLEAVPFTSDITTLNRRIKYRPDILKKPNFDQDNLGFLVDAVGRVEEDYTLSPLDLISIWTTSCHIMGDYLRRRLGIIISTDYASRGVKSLSWRGVPRHVLETYKLPDNVLEDQVGVKTFLGRLYGVYNGLHLLQPYLYGVLKEAESAQRNNPRKRIIEDIEKGLEQPDKVVYEVHENMLNVFMLLEKTFDDDRIRGVEIKPLDPVITSLKEIKG